MRVACVARGNGVAAARVLASTLRASGVDWPLVVLLLPGIRPALSDDEPFSTVTAADLASPVLERLIAVAPPEALLALARPLLAAHLLATHDEDLLLVSADTEIHGPPDDLLAALTREDVVLVPRLNGKLPDDGERPGGADLIDAGEIDDGLVAIRSSDNGRAFAEWWAARAVDSGRAVSSAPDGESPDVPRRLWSSPLGVADRVLPGVARLEHPGYAVSYWNLHERALGRDGDGYTADGKPARVLRFDGFRADRPWWLSEDASRTIVLDDPVLTEICGARARALNDAGWINVAAIDAAPDELGNGLLLDARLRSLLAEAQDAGEDFGDVFSTSGADAFASWLRDAAPQGGRAGITRYAFDVWRGRSDVRTAYPDLEGPDADGFIGWLWVHGRPELRLQTAVLPDPPDWARDAEPAPPAVVVTGYLRGNLGLGEAARGYVAALEAAGVPVATHSISPDPPVDRRPTGAKARPDERAFTDIALPDGVRPEINLACVNADQLPELAREVGETSFREKYTIGLWAWETDVIPERWGPSFGLVDEIWTYSRYVAENIARASDKPVVVVPPPVEPPDAHGASVPFALPDGFVFLFAFDFFSTLQRKNPLGLVEAFSRAFAPGEGPFLVLKTINADFRPEARERLRHAIGAREDILLIDAGLTPDQLAALFARADAYVSLHRAEGFGLTMAEAMALGKPVVATGYSANTDFMTPANSYLVDWSPTSVGPEGEHYPAEATWADPSIEHAAAQMRLVWTDQDEARRRGERARADVRATLSTAVVGAIARARLERIGSIPSRPPGPTRPAGDISRYLRQDAARATGARGLARRAALRAVRPYAAARREFDDAVAAAVHRLDVELEQERAARERDRLRIVRLERRLAAMERDRR